MSVVLRCLVAAAAACWLILPASPAGAVAATDPSVGTITNFGPNLQQAVGGVCRQPEGLAIDPSGNLYAASNSDTATTVGHICVLDRTGRLTGVIEVPAGAVPTVDLLGELWAQGRLLALDQADDVAPHGRLLSIDPATHRVTALASGFAFPNAVVTDSRGYLYVSDSLQGRVYRLWPDGSHLTVWSQDALLSTANPNLPVGANGMAFDRGEHSLYVANSGNRQIVRIPVGADRSAAAGQVFADGASLDAQLGLASPTALFAADGIQFDVAGNLYVMANQVNEVQVLSDQGRLIHRYTGTGSNALDFNASDVFSGSRLYITDMSGADGGVNSKLSVLQAPVPGLLRP
jgi:sugar lactone lactonase YvrE